MNRRDKKDVARMKTVIIHGQSHKGSTYHIAQHGMHSVFYE